MVSNREKVAAVIIVISVLKIKTEKCVRTQTGSKTEIAWCI